MQDGLGAFMFSNARFRRENQTSDLCNLLCSAFVNVLTDTVRLALLINKPTLSSTGQQVICFTATGGIYDAFPQLFKSSV